MILTSVAEKMSARKALSYIGASNNMLYHVHVSKKHKTPLDDKVKNTVNKISIERPAYGTRRLAAAASKALKKPVSRKKVQRICQKTGLIPPPP